MAAGAQRLVRHPGPGLAADPGPLSRIAARVFAHPWARSGFLSGGRCSWFWPGSAYLFFLLVSPIVNAIRDLVQQWVPVDDLAESGELPSLFDPGDAGQP